MYIPDSSSWRKQRVGGNNCFSMHPVFADAGLSKNNKIKLFSRNGLKNDINVSDLWHPSVTILKYKMGFLRDYLSSKRRLCTETIARAQFQLTFFLKAWDSMLFRTFLIN